MKKRISVLLCKAVIALLILLLPSVEKEQAGVSLVFFWLAKQRVDRQRVF